ncbi:histidine kinase [Crocinitomicaceae bacterium]|nr:histidine kinase [Crocinitomicaceae bacterium]
MIFKKFLVFILILITGQGYGQQYEPYKINYGVNEGLPSSECYEIIQDSKGYIWFGTDRGVVKYNGYEFVTYTTKEGLNNNVVFYLKEGPDGKIWFYDIENQLSYFYNDQIYPFKYNDLLNKFLPKNSKPIGINIDSNNNIYFNFIGNVKEIISSINMLGELTFHDSNSHDIFFSFINEDFVSAHFTNNGSDEKPNITFNVCYQKNNRKTISSFSSNLNLYNSIFRYKKYGENIYFSYMNELYLMRPNGEITKLHTFNSSIIELEVTLDGDLFIGLYDEGLMILPNGNPQEMYKMISDCSVSGVCFDDSQGVWLTTQDKGIYYVPKSKFSQHIESKDQLINHISGDDNGIFYTNYAGEIFNLNSAAKSSVSNNKSLGYIRNLISVNNDVYLGSLSSNYHFIYDQSTSVIQKMKGSSVDWLITENEIYGIFNGRIVLFDRNSYGFKQNLVSTNVKFDCIENGFENNKLILGSSQGVYSYDMDTVQKEFMQYAIYDTRISDFFKIDNVLYTATRGEGLIIHEQNEVPYALTKSNGLVSNEIHKLKCFNNNLFVLSKEGMSVVDLSSEKLKIVNLTNKNGLISNEVNDVFSRNDSLWVATNKGITKFNLTQINEPVLDCPIYLKDVFINGGKKQVNELSSLSYDENELEFSFEAISFNSQGSINYRYKLIGVDENWNYTESRMLRYPNLAPGNYKFVISYQKPDLTWSIPTTLFKTTISKPFWEELFFIIPILLFFTFIIYFLAQRFVNKTRKKIEVQRKILDLERRALQAQMSPHFIFNALTSIQSLISQNKNENAEEFLVTFSRLVRTALNQSSQTYIPLKEELEMLNNYLKIESLRFDSVFEWEIGLPKNLNIDEISIPPMMIQPFVENAIEHGLRPMSDKGRVMIQFYLKEDTLLEVTVEDNGVGREMSAKKKNIGRESKGINLVKDRMNLLRNKARLQIIDKSDNGVSAGTQVILLVPIQNNNDENSYN